MKLATFKDSMILPSWKYPGGELGVRMKHDVFPHGAPIVHRIQSSDDLIELVMIADSLKRQGVKLNEIDIIVPYLPYARQDRVATNGDPHSLAVVCRILDGLGFRSITTLDAHSNVAEACFDKTQFKNITSEIYLSGFVDKIGYCGTGSFALVCPDEGAIKKTQSYAAYLGNVVSGIFYCTKKRDPVSGKLIGFDCNIPDTMKFWNNPRLLIADDICDGAGTFLGIADTIRKILPDAELSLFTTHGIFSKGTNVIYEKFKHVGSTNSFIPNKPEFAADKPFTLVPLEYHPTLTV